MPVLTIGLFLTIFTSSVIPDMYFTINGNKWRNISTINATSDQLLTLICHADGTRPVIQLRWELHTINVDTNSVPVRNNDNQTFNITSFLKFEPNETETNIMCFTQGLPDHDIFIMAYIRVPGKLFTL